MMARRLAPTLLAALLLSACAAARPDSPFTAAQGERNVIRIEVQNHNFDDATLWAVVQNARRIRLGRVTGKSDAQFSIPWSFSESLSIEIDMMAGPRCLTSSVTVDPGDVLELQIQPVFSNTADCVQR